MIYLKKCHWKFTVSSKIIYVCISAPKIQNDESSFDGKRCDNQKYKPLQILKLEFKIFAIFAIISDVTSVVFLSENA